MSGLYNVVLGDGNEETRGALLGRTMLNIQRDDFGRFRDAWLEDDGTGNLRIAIYTRNGGGNRPDYEDVTNALRQHPLYLDDRDDTFDSTYATYYFRFPPSVPQHLIDAGAKGWDELNWADFTERMREEAYDEPVNMNAMWQKAIQKVQTEGPTKEQMEAMAPMIEELTQALGTSNPDEINFIATGRDPKRLIEGESE